MFPVIILWRAFLVRHHWFIHHLILLAMGWKILGSSPSAVSGAAACVWSTDSLARLYYVFFLGGGANYYSEIDISAVLILISCVTAVCFSPVLLVGLKH